MKAVSIDVTNVGEVDSDETVQCYVKQPRASVPVPQVRLAGFARVHLPANSTRTVVVSIAPNAHTAVLSPGGDATGNDIYTAGSSVVVEKGAFEVHCGHGQPDFDPHVLTVTVEVVDQGKRLDEC